MALPLVFGFGIKPAGVAVPWRAPELTWGIWGTAIGTWLLLALLILLAFGLGALVRHAISRVGFAPRPGTTA